MDIRVVSTPENNQINSFYPSHKAPLLSSPFSKLPVGNVRAKGWLKHQLELMVDGLVGRLPEISPYLQSENSWLGGERPGWEEQPYWLRGFYDLAVLTDNEKLKNQALSWIEAIINSQEESGYFGPKNNGIHDIWPHIIMLDALRSHYDYTNDYRVIQLIEGFLKYCHDLSDEAFIPYFNNADEWSRFAKKYGKPKTQSKRAGDMLPHIYWLYDYIGEEWLLDLAKIGRAHV